MVHRVDHLLVLTLRNSHHHLSSFFFLVLVMSSVCHHDDLQNHLLLQLPHCTSDGVVRCVEADDSCSFIGPVDLNSDSFEF